MSKNPSYNNLVQAALNTIDVVNGLHTEEARQRFVMTAGVNATLAIAEQQRITNLIAYATLLQQCGPDEALTAERIAAVEALESQIADALLSNGN